MPYQTGGVAACCLYMKLTRPSIRFLLANLAVIVLLTFYINTYIQYCECDLSLTAYCVVSFKRFLFAIMRHYDGYDECSQQKSFEL